MDEDARGHWETTYYGGCDIRVSIRIGDNIPHDDAIDFIERHCSEPIRVVSVENEDTATEISFRMCIRAKWKRGCLRETIEEEVDKVIPDMYDWKVDSIYTDVDDVDEEWCD